MKCSKCFRENSPGVKFCAFCGATMNSFQNVSSKTSYSHQGSNKTMISPGGAYQQGYSFNEVIIGRDSGNDIIITDQGVSGKHAKIYLDAGTLYIEDLRSLNGTFVNGARVTNRMRIKPSDRINLGTHYLNTSHNLLTGLFAKSNDGDVIQDGTIRLSFNPNWIGKIIYFILIILFLLPWVTLSGAGSEVSFTAFDFAMNRLPAGITIKAVNFPGYGGAHTIFLILFILTVVGLIMNFIRLPITSKLNLVNILSLVIFILAVIVPVSSDSSGDSSLKGILDFLSINFGFAAYLFILLTFISIFEGVIEYYVSANK